jgi:hypothetical protein
MFRSIMISLFVAGLSAGCANMTPVASGGYYCLVESGAACASHEGNGDCQPCPRSTAASVASTAAPATPAILPGRQD